MSLSGGKDSTAMLLRMLEEGMPVDEILFCNTGMEFPQMYRHLEKLERYITRPIIRLNPPVGFEALFYEYQPVRKNPTLVNCKGMSWPGPRARWCTGRLKERVVNRYLREMRKEFNLIQYIGIAADEPYRVKQHHYPLVDWGMTEKDCLSYCLQRGFDWDGLYRIFERVSCWCCPLQPLEELRKLYRHCPELWEKLQYMDDHTWRQFRRDYSVRQLGLRFHLEEERLAQGLSIRNKEFFSLFKERLNHRKGGDPS